MASRANIKATVSADTTQFSTAMRRAQITAGETARRIGRAAASAAASLGGMAARATAMGAAMAKAATIGAAFKGVKMAAEIEQIGISFEVMTGSAERGKAVLEEIRKFGAETPYEFPALAKGAQTLLAFGISAEQVVPTMRMLGDVAAGDAQKLESLALVFGQIKSAGKLTGGDMLQLINVGFNPLNIIAEKTGKNMGVLRDEMSKGLITFDMVSDAFKTATSEGGQFFGMTDRQSKTFNGLMSTLTDSVNATLMTMGQPLMESLIPYIKEATKQAELLAPRFKEIGETMGENIQNAIQFANVIYKIAQVVKRVGEFIGVVFGALFSKEYWKALLDSVLSVFADGLAKASRFAEKLTGKDIFKRLAEGFESEADRLKNEAEPIAKIYDDAFADIFTKPLDSLESFFDGLKPKIEEAVKPLWEVEGVLQPAATDEPFGPPKSLAPKLSAAPQQDGTKFGPDKNLAGSPQIFGPDKSLMSDRGRIFQMLQKRGMSEAAAGFGGLSERTMMQASRVLGQGPGTNTMLSGGRGSGRWAGVANASVTGGLGEKRRLRTSKDDKDAKKNMSLQEKQVTALESIESNIKQAVTVG